jgi:AbrB family looped-hinge helix DNA binding protein
MTAPTVSVTISKEGKIAIPKKLRKALSLNYGQSVVLRQQGRGILIEKSDQTSLRARAESLVREAKASAASKALSLKPDAVWAQYDAAASSLRKALRRKRTSRRKC